VPETATAVVTCALPPLGVGPDTSDYRLEGFTLGGSPTTQFRGRGFWSAIRLGRKLMVVAEGANHSVEFVRGRFRGIFAI